MSVLNHACFISNLDCVCMECTEELLKYIRAFSSTEDAQLSTSPQLKNK